ncbi:MAG: hypothetical protein AAF690_23730 [Acidobacteriota bacterium]
MLKAMVGWTVLACLVAPLSSEERTFTGAGFSPPFGRPLSSPWQRPAVGGLAEASAFWESTGFYVTESGQYLLHNEVDLSREPQFVAFPRVLFLYSHRFDPDAPERNLMGSWDVADGAQELTVPVQLVAHNMYHLVLSSVDETLLVGSDDHLLRVQTTISGPGAIGRNYCRFTDDVVNDAEGEQWDERAAMATERGAFGVEQMCVSIRWLDDEGRFHQAPVAPQRTRDSVLFYFFDERNWEVNVKMLDGCDVNNRYWLLASSSTDVPFEMRVRWLGYDAFVSSESPAFEAYGGGFGGELVYRHPGGGPAETVIDVNSIVCQR